jgi:hydroxymethylpyrimidine/phosphomethylpyrimidine kinase
LLPALIEPRSCDFTAFQISRDGVTMTGMKRSRREISVLCICGVDPLGYSGIAMDLRALAQCGATASLAITALTSQTRDAVLAIGTRPAAHVVRDIGDVIRNRRPAAIKIGMLGSGKIASAVAAALREAHEDSIPIVLDPVLNASSGGRLSSRDLVRSMRNHLLPICSVITPNVPEAEALLGTRIRTLGEMAAAAHSLAGYCGGGVYLKGGHLAALRVADILVSKNNTWILGGRTLRASRGTRLDPRGTGCALSSALAAQLARGKSLPVAAAAARRVVVEWIRNEGSMRK